MRNLRDFRGIHVPLVTCFQDKTIRLDEEAQEKVIEYVINQQNVDGIIACATTGEFAALDEEAYKKTALFILHKAKAIKKNIVVMLGTTSMNPQVTTERNKWACDIGFDGILSTYPPYIKPDQRGMINYFEEIAEATPKLPIFLYNIWYRTGGAGMNAQTIIHLAKISNIFGIKDCGVSIDHIDEVIEHTDREQFVYLTGEDSMLFDVLAHGGDGALFATAHVVGKEMKQILKLIKEQNLLEALNVHRRIKPLINALFSEPNPAPLKFALNELGINVGNSCGPAILPVMEKTKELVRKGLSLL